MLASRFFFPVVLAATTFSAVISVAVFGLSVAVGSETFKRILRIGASQLIDTAKLFTFGLLIISILSIRMFMLNGCVVMLNPKLVAGALALFFLYDFALKWRVFS